MPNVKYLCVLPVVENDTDRIRKLTVRGSLLQSPQEFSVNFVNSPTCTDDITYHFKVIIPFQTIIENYKQKGEWSDSHKETYLNIFDGTGCKNSKSDVINNNNGLDAVSSTETEFYLEFIFDYDNSVIGVYQVRETGHNFISRYETLFDPSAIQAVQIWGDVKKIKLFSMIYD